MMNYKAYTKLESILESLNSAKTKFTGTEEEFEQLKELDPTAGKKWKYMDFIVKVGYQKDLYDLLSEFEKLTNKNIIKKKDINNYDYIMLKSSVVHHKNFTTKRQAKIIAKKDIIIVNQDPLVIIPLTEKASTYYGKGTRWCTSALEDNVFNEYFMGQDLTLFYVINDSRWAVVMDYNGDLDECRNITDEIVSVTETGLEEEDFERWFQENQDKIKDAKSKNPLMLFSCIETNEFNKVKEMVENGVDINIRYNYKTPLLVACCENTTEMVELFLNHGAQKDINTKDNFNNTPIYWACANSNLGMAEILLNHGAQKSINVKNQFHNTPIYIACLADNLGLVRLLLDNGAQKSINVKNHNNNTPLYQACYHHNVEMAKVLLQHGAQESINYKHNVDHTLLSGMLHGSGNQEMIDLLISYGATE